MLQNELERIINEQFSFVKVLSRKEGSSAVVLRHRTLDRKVVKIDTVRNYEIYETLNRIKHENLPSIIGIIRKPEGFSVIEEYVDGISVAQVLESGLYNEKGVRSVCKSVALALDVLHSCNIIHRDVKPENIMIDSTGTVKLIDFDAARIYKHYQPTDTSFVGTAGFAAPEQYGVNQSDARTDIFAMGVLMNVMLTGEHPVTKAYKGKMSKIIRKCINVNPEERYASAMELYKKL